MNKTKLKLIELLSEYMDKTLCSECIVNSPDWGYWYYVFEHNHGTDNISTVDNGILEVSLDSCEIIGHLDISAVLNYMEEVCEHLCVYVHNGMFTIDFEVSGKIGQFEIPNKPLITFTDQELEELLTLLLKLKDV